MDLSNYPNILNLCNQLGKVRQNAFNKKQYAAAEEQWNRFTPEEKMWINNEAQTAVPVLKCFVSPNYIFALDMAAFFVIPVRDTIWVYPFVFTSKMNFIPYDKAHSLKLMDRNGRVYTLGEKHTGGFSKKQPCQEAMEKLVNVIWPQRRGLIVGWTEPIAQSINNNFSGIVQAVDTNSMVQNAQNI